MLGGGDEEARGRLEERIEELAEAFMLLIAATGFLEVSFDARGSFLCGRGANDVMQFENEQMPVEKPRVGTMLFH